MKPSALDAESLKQLSLADTVSWLKAAGWSASPEDHDRFVRFTKNTEEGLAEVDLPRRPDFRDHHLRMAEVIDIAATVEARPHAEILREIRGTAILDPEAKEFRAREPQPDFELRGPILELASEDPSLGGTLTIGGALDNRVVRVRVQVSRTDYARALKAHEEKRVVLTEGELVREGRSFALRNARNFSVEMDE